MVDKRLLADLARKNGSRILTTAIDVLLPLEASKLPGRKKRSLVGGMVGAVASRVATRSVPGAIVVGGALLAKRLYDRRHANDTANDTAKVPEKDQPKA